jgi:hypothetical protein
MSGIFYDPRTRQLRRVQGKPGADWQLVTHNVDAPLHHCRRIMREWLRAEEISHVDFSAGEALSA